MQGRRSYKGTIAQATDTQVTLELEGEDPATISYDEVKKCVLKPVFDFKPKKGEVNGIRYEWTLMALCARRRTSTSSYPIDRLEQSLLPRATPRSCILIGAPRSPIDRPMARFTSYKLIPSMILWTKRATTPSGKRSTSPSRYFSHRRPARQGGRSTPSSATRPRADSMRSSPVVSGDIINGTVLQVQFRTSPS